MLAARAVGAQTSQEANEYNKVSIASPTAASLGKFVDIPVSLHTGIPQISIPMYNITDGPLSLPVSVSYHASGLKTLETAGWVGAGWALNAGGVITRSVRGTPDEKGTVNNLQHTGFFSDYGYRNHLLEVGSGGRGDSSLVTHYLRFRDGEFDSEPDLFFFNFGGYSGKFYFNDDRTPMMLPEQDIKIEYNYTYGSSESIQGFTLTTPDGVKYYFGATPSTTDVDPVEYTKVFTDQNGMGWDKVLSSWYLNKIVSADGNSSISLSYRSVGYSYYTVSTSVETGNARGYKLVRNIIHGVELDKITSSNGQLNFVPALVAREDLSNTNTNGVEGVNTSAKALARIDVLQKNGQTLLKSYNFLYDYFVDSTSSVATTLNVVTTDRKRLKLLSIQEISGAGAANPPYRFDYFAEPVPRRMSFGQDHWGFINGVTSNGDNLIATYYNTYSTKTTVTGADRDPKWPAMRGGTLKKITFPTGGYNLYDFEANQFYKSVISGTNGDRTFINSVSAGYDGGQTTKTSFILQALDYHQYVFQLSNGHYGGTGHMNVYNSSNALVDQLSAANDQTVEIMRNYAPGTYKFEAVKDNAYSGNGALINIYQLAGSVVSTNETVGGLRIKTITQNSGNGRPDMVTNYSYNDGPNNLSTGILFGKPTVAQVLRNEIDKNFFTADQTGYTGMYPEGCPTTPGSGLPYMVSAGSVRAMSSSQGSHIGYKKVTVSQPGNGYSVSIFNTDGENSITHDDIANRTIITSPGTCTADIPNYPSAPEPNSFKRGQLQYKADFTESGSLISDATFTSEFQDNPMTTPAFAIVGNPTSSTIPSFFTWYDQKTGRKVKETSVRNLYNSNGTVTMKEESYFDSPYHHQQTRKVTYNTVGDTLETRYRYVPDFTLTSVDGLNTDVDDYLTQFDNATSAFNASVAACSGSVPCQRIAWLDYDIALCHKRLDFINYRIANFTGPNNTYAARLQQVLSTVSSQLKPLIGLRLQNGIMPVEVINLKNGKVLGATFSTLDYKPASQNQIYLSKISKTDFLTPPASFTASQTGADNVSLTKDANYNEKAAFEYDYGNISQTTLKDDAPTAYLWGYNRQHPVAAVKNALANEIMYNGFEEAGGWDANLTAYDATFKRTGLSSGRIDAPSATQVACMGTKWLSISLTAAKKFRYSAWVYSNGPGAEILLFMKRAGETAAYTYVNSVVTTATGTWTYIEKDYLVPADVTQLNIRIDNNGALNGGTKVWFDDLRLYPSDAQMTSYTFNPLIGMTSSTDSRNMTTFYEYDDQQRLMNVKDQKGQILSNNTYSYLSTDPQWTDTNLFQCVQGANGNTGERQKQQKDVNTVSSTYNQTRWVSMGTDLGNCPIPPTIYVQQTTGSTSVSNGLTYHTLKFNTYSDANCTTLINAPVTLTVNYRYVTSRSYADGRTPNPEVTTTNATITIAAGSNQATSGSIIISGCFGTADKQICYTPGTQITVQSGTGYVAVNPEI